MRFNDLVSLRIPRPSDAVLIVRWRNKSLSSFFSEDKPLTLDSHRRWYSSISQDKSQRYFVIEYSGRPIGTIGLMNMDETQAEYGRFLIAPGERRKGYGRAALNLLLEYSFHKMFSLNRVYGDILANNTAALALDRKLGFKQAEVFKDHVQKKGKTYDVIRMEIFKDEWSRINYGNSGPEERPQDLQTSGGQRGRSL